MTDYHFHHPEKMFTDRAELTEIILGQRLMTLALALMIRQLEPDPEPVLQRLLVKARLTSTIVGRVQVLAVTGKRNAVQSVTLSGSTAQG